MRDDGGDAPASDRKPSPSIWADCPNSLLNDLGLGRFVHEDFYAATADTIATGVPLPQGQFALDGDTGGVVAVTPVDLTGGRVDLQTGTTDNDAVALFQQIGPGLVINGDIKVWFEARFSIGDVTADQGIFLGLAEEDFLSRDVILDDCASIGAQSCFGFGVWAGDPNDLEAMWNLDAGTGTVALQDVTNAAVYTSQSGDTAAGLANGTYYRVGLKFDGRTNLKWFVNGYEVAEITVTDGTHPDDVEMGPIAAIKTGTAAAQSFNLDWIRYAHQEAY
jgi:hypothetical protein